MSKSRGQEFENLNQMVLPSDGVLFNSESFDEFLRTQGVTFVHFRSMRCPISLTDENDIRQAHDHHFDCSNGFVYTEAGEITCGFLGNSKESRLTDMGRLDGSTVNIVLPRTYDCDTAKEVEIAPFDRMYLKNKNITVVTWHLFSAHISGVDRLMFPAVSVTDLMDSNGKKYTQCKDFEIVNGQIHWGPNRPGVDPKTGKGVVCSVRFKYHPFFYVQRLPHEIRVTKTTNDFGDEEEQLMPKQAVLVREYFYHKEQNDPKAKDPENRQHPGPADGQFGSR